MSRTLSAPGRGPSVVLAGALVLALVALAAVTLAPRATAAFSIGKCGGSAITGRGASFARDAHNTVFIPRFKNFFCPGSSAKVTYDAAGSGAGRLSVKVRTDTPRFGMTDEAPGPAEVALMNSGTNAKEEVDGDPSNDGKIHVVPAAVGAVAPLVNFPDACDPTKLGAEFRTVSNVTTEKALLRVRFPKVLFEKVWAGEIKKWDAAFPELAGGSCVDVPIIRVVRFDESGTSFAFKDELNALNPTRNWLTEFATVKPALTRKWPNAAPFGPREDCPPVAGVFPEGPGADSAVPGQPGPDQLMSACSNSNGPLVTTLINTDGSIGYSDISTARTANPTLAVNPAGSAPPDKYWTQLQDGAEPPVWQEPTEDPNGYKTNGTPGANCALAKFKNLPPTTFGDWSKASGVNSPGAYGVCTMTYGLVFDDNAPVWAKPETFAQEEANARTVKDYWESLLTEGSQAALISKDYAPLPASILAISKAGIEQVGWNKSASGGGGGGGGTGGGGGGTGGGTPPVVKPSNAFSLLRKSISSKTGGATVSVKLPGAGKLEMLVTAKVQNGNGAARAAKVKTITVAKATLNASKAGTYNVPLRPSAAAMKALRKKGSLPVKLKMTFTPTGGDPNESTSTLVLKMKKPAKRR